MKKMLTLLLAISLLCACMPAHAAYQAVSYAHVIDASADRDIPVAKPTEDGHYAPNPVIEGESSTTGLPSDAEYLPMLVNIDNSGEAKPQWGIAGADIVYEMPIHGHYQTRLIALFTHDHPEAAGPVRSGRVIHADLREEWDSAWVFYGCQEAEGTNVNTLLKKYGLARREGTVIYDGANGAKAWSPSFVRVKHHKAPSNVTANVQELSGLARESGHVFTQRPFLFTDEKPALGVDAAKVSVVFNGGSYDADAYYAYNADENRYMRTVGYGPYVDMLDENTQLGYENVIVQYTNLKFYSGNASRPTLPNIVGEGNADIFTGGKYIAGYWVRTGLDERTVFFDSEGNEIQLQRGKTWITVTTEKTVVSYE